MVEKSSNNRKKDTITEEHAATLLQRYSAETVLALLQEVSKNAGQKIDWNALVKNTTTGISSAMEYQMLWRHLAYGHTLIDQINDADIPLDDDSDLELERESFPPPSPEASAEVAAYVKVLMTSGCTNDHELLNDSYIEAPLTINIPNIRAITAPPDSSIQANTMHGTNITIPVFIEKEQPSTGKTGNKRPIKETSRVNQPPQRKRKAWSVEEEQPSSGKTGDKRPVKETSRVNTPPQGKRKVWSAEEDMKLTAAVQKNGDYNWAYIVSGDFMNGRKASELSQRWSSLKKKQGNLKGGFSSQLPQTQLAAAHRAMSLALDMPMGDNLKSSHTSYVGPNPRHQPQKPSASPLEFRSGTAGPPKSQVQTGKPPLYPTSRSDPMIQAAAIAAGARIFTSADAASLIGATRTQNTVHIKTGGSPVINPPTFTNQLPSNVHFIRDGLAKSPFSAHSATKPNISRPGEAHQAQGHSIKPALAGGQLSPVVTAPVLNNSSRWQIPQP